MTLRNPPSFNNTALTGATTASNITASGQVQAATLKATGVLVRTGYQIASPLTGATVVVGAGKSDLRLSPAGTLAALTITLPGSPVDGQILRVTTSQTITALTINGGSMFPATPTTLPANGVLEFQYWGAGTAWQT